MSIPDPYVFADPYVFVFLSSLGLRPGRYPNSILAPQEMTLPRIKAGDQRIEAWRIEVVVI